MKLRSIVSAPATASWRLLREFAYSAPSDPETLFYDFYAIMSLSGFGPNTRHMPDKVFSTGSRELDHELTVTLAELISVLKPQLLNVVFKSAVAEFFHAFFPSSYSASDEHIENILGDYAPVFFVWREDWQNKTHTLWNMARAVFTTIDKNRLYQQNSQATVDNLLAIYRSLDRHRLMSMMEMIYADEKHWAPNVGGEAWRNICESWADLSEANGLWAITQQIDHIYDLVHNTASVFSKIPEYDWFKEALDFKYANDPLDRASRGMNIIVRQARLLAGRGGRIMEPEETKEKKKIPYQPGWRATLTQKHPDMPNPYAEDSPAGKITE